MTNENPNEVLVPITSAKDVREGDELVCVAADYCETGLTAGFRVTVSLNPTTRSGRYDALGDHVAVRRVGGDECGTLGPYWTSVGYRFQDWQKVVKPPVGETWTKIDSYADLKVGDELVCVVPKPKTTGMKFLGRCTVTSIREGEFFTSDGWSIREYEPRPEWRREGHRLVEKTTVTKTDSKETTMVRDAMGAIPRGTQVWRKSDGKPGTIYSVKGDYFSSGNCGTSLQRVGYEVSLGVTHEFYSSSMDEAALRRDYSFTKPEAPKDCICTYLVNEDGTPHQTRETPTTEEYAKRIAKDLGAPWKAYRLVPLDG